MSDGMSDARVRSRKAKKLEVRPGLVLDIEEIETGWGTSYRVIENSPWFDWRDSFEEYLRDAIRKDIGHADFVQHFLAKRAEALRDQAASKK